MAMKKSPLQRVKELYGNKEGLVDKLMGLLERGEETKEEMRARLLRVPNAKLLHLHQVMTEVKERFGSKEKLVETTLGLMNRAKDKDFQAKLLSYTPARLLDLYRTWQKKNK